MKRELLSRNNFRLNEDIHVGEDNAFQFRIYPKAKGITLISDKLYNYRWYREDSLMNSIVYKNFEKKCVSHIKLILHIAKEWQKSGDMEKMGGEFIKWSVEFLYDDFIKMPLNTRIANAKALAEMWTKAGFFRYQYSYPDYIRDMFRYFYSVAKEAPQTCKVSMIISADRDYSYFENTVKSCLEQNMRDIELIIVNNGASSATYSVIHKYLHKDKRVRVYNTAKGHFTDGYNIGIEICSGEYALFVHPDDWLESPDALPEWLDEAARNNNDVCLCLHKSSDSTCYSGSPIKSDEDEADYYLDCEIGNALFKTDYIKAAELEFEDYSVESGKVFLAEAVLNASSVAVIKKSLYISRNVYKQDWIPTEQCVKVLKSFADRLEIAEKYNAVQLHNKVFSLLVSDYYMNILVNNTRPYFMKLIDCPNGENSQSETLAQLLRILSLIDPAMLPKQNGSVPAVPLLFSKFVDGRHKYIADVSDEYVKV